MAAASQLCRSSVCFASAVASVACPHASKQAYAAEQAARIGPTQLVVPTPGSSSTFPRRQSSPKRGDESERRNNVIIHYDNWPLFATASKASKQCEAHTQGHKRAVSSSTTTTTTMQISDNHLQHFAKTTPPPNQGGPSDVKEKENATMRHAQMQGREKKCSGTTKQPPG